MKTLMMLLAVATATPTPEPPALAWTHVTAFGADYIDMTSLRRDDADMVLARTLHVPFDPTFRPQWTEVRFDCSAWTWQPRWSESADPDRARGRNSLNEPATALPMEGMGATVGRLACGRDATPATTLASVAAAEADARSLVSRIRHEPDLYAEVGEPVLPLRFVMADDMGQGWFYDPLTLHRFEGASEVEVLRISANTENEGDPISHGWMTMRYDCADRTVDGRLQRNIEEGRIVESIDESEGEPLGVHVHDAHQTLFEIVCEGASDEALIDAADLEVAIAMSVDAWRGPVH